MFLQVDERQVKKKFSGILEGNGSKNGRLNSQVDCQATIEIVLVPEIEFELLYILLNRKSVIELLTYL